MMTLEHAISKATLFYDMIGAKVKNTKKNKIKVVSRVTAYKKDGNSWDVAIFLRQNIGQKLVNPSAICGSFYEIMR